VQLEMRGQVAYVTLNRPQARNALSVALVSSLQATLDRLAALLTEPAVRDSTGSTSRAGGPGAISCLVLSGASDRAFCAGADLKERRGMSDNDTRGFLQTLGQVCASLAAFPRPTIAAINGAAFGGGFELALCCDIRIAVADAQLALPEVKLGIIPGAGGTQRLSRACGLGVAKSLVLTGRRITAQQALALHIVSAIAERSDFEALIQSWAQEISSAGPLALQQAKAALDAGLQLPLDEALVLERACYEEVLGSSDRLEGLQAFAEKRAPNYRGR